MNKGSWILFISLLTVTLGGSFAFWWVEDDWTWLDALYMTVISLTTVGYGEVHPLSSAGRIVAMLVLFFGLGVFGYFIAQITSFAVSGAIGDTLQRSRTARAVKRLSGHRIVCGLGDRGRALSRGETNTVAIELDTRNFAVEALRRNGALVFHGNAHQDSFLKFSGASRASQIIVTTGTDNKNMEVACEIQRYLGQSSQAQVIAAVEDYSARDCFSDVLSKQGVALFGFKEQSLIELAKTLAEEIVESWTQLPKQSLTLVMQVEDGLLEEVLRVFAMVLQFGGLNKLHILAYGVSAEDRPSFEARFPEYTRCCTITWNEKAFSSALILDKTPDLAFFFSGSVTRSIELAKRFLHSGCDVAADRVYACSEQMSLSKSVAAEICDDSSFPRVLALYDLIGQNGSLVSYAMEAEGRALHEAYIGSVEHAVKEWDEISEFHRNSNRLAALQREIYSRIWKKISSTNAEDKLLDYLAQCEHLRWMSFHLMCGYRLDQNNLPRAQWPQRKMHPELIAFEELDETTNARLVGSVRQSVGLK